MRQIIPRRLWGLKVMAMLLVTLMTTPASATPMLDTTIEKLKGRIIRSLSVAPFNDSWLVVGNKGKNAGDALVFASDNAGISWRFLNQGKSLAPGASDVQAVQYLSADILLAGTWKHGLYRSANAGRSFERVDSFPASDVRSIAVDSRDTQTVYVATGADGVLKSTDAGLTWQTTSLSKGYIWSVRISASGDLLASSPNSGLYYLPPGGERWDRLLASVKVSDASIKESTTGGTTSGKTIAVAAEDGLHVSHDGGQQWIRPDVLLGRRLSSVRFDVAEPATLWLGDWNGGVWKYSLTENTAAHSVSAASVVHIAQNSHSLLLGSWGKGLHIIPHTSGGLLIAAAQANDASIVGRLLKAGADPDAFDRARNTALVFAARDGYQEVADLLIQGGASVNWIDGEGVTPLILAAHKNHPALVSLLLEHQADVAIVDQYGNTAMDYARRRGDADPVVQLLEKRR